LIPQVAITQWRNTAPWRDMHQVEQDLVISRALVAIYSDNVLSKSLAFRGGTALHKLYLSPQARYSEDLDFVQVNSETIGQTLNRLRNALAFIGEPKTKRKASNNVILLSFETTFAPIIELKIKVEINCKEHFHVLERIELPFTVNSLWFTGECSILTYRIEELSGTKLRALYQRKKSRDLFDLALACSTIDLNTDEVLECYRRYITYPGNRMPTAIEFLNNLKAKLADQVFRDDVYPLLRPDIRYDIDEAAKN